MPNLQNGYTQHHVPVYSIDPVSGEELVIVQDCSVWIGALDNEAFGGSGHRSVDQGACVR